MTPTDWLSRGVSLLRPNLETKATAASGSTAHAGAQDAPAPAVHPRSTRERLKATLRRRQEALSPRVLRRTLTELQAIIDPQVSEVEGGRRAKALAVWYAQASAEERRDCWLLMSEQFAPDANKLKAVREQYEAAQGTAEEGQAEIRMRKALVSPRTRLLQRFAVFPEGMRFLVDLRAELLPHLKGDKRLLALDAELETLFSTWFDVAFLELRRISWDSPASLIEKLIKYEAVHDIRGWADVKNRLDSDRRCYGFFHPRLDSEPLIFVEVALSGEIAGCITPLLDEAAAPSDLTKATTAIFYSISSTQAGLRGVELRRLADQARGGDAQGRISQAQDVCHAVAAAGPASLARHATQGRCWSGSIRNRRAALARALGAEPTARDLLAAWDQPLQELDAKSPLRLMLLRGAATYLGRELQDGKPIDPVARFHLGNGARIERLNWAGDPSAKGHRQSYGLMVNYLYDLKRLDKHRTLLAHGQVPVSGAIEDLYI